MIRSSCCRKLSTQCKTNAWTRFPQHGFSTQSGLFPEEHMIHTSPQISDFNSHAYASMLQNCIVNGESTTGKSLHCHILKRGGCLDVFAYNVLLNMYVKSDLLSDAHKVFDEMPERNTVSFVTLIQGCAMALRFVEGIELFFRLHREGHELNPFVFTTILKVLVTMEWAELGWGVHACIQKLGHGSDAFVGTALIDAYSACGLVDAAREAFNEIIHKDMVSWTGMDARRVFEEIPKDDVIPWSFMIARCSQSDRSEEAVELFCRMWQTLVMPNQFTFASVLQACATMAGLDLGKQIHCHVLKVGLDSNVFVSNALMDVYAKCGKMGNSVELFMESTNRNDVTWNTLIVGYVQLGDGDKALNLFLDMLGDQVKATEVTYSSVLRACAGLAALEPGTQIHSLTIKTIYDRDIPVANALIDIISALHVLEMEPQDEATYVLLSNMYATARRWDNVASVRKSMKKKGVKKEPGLSWTENQGTVHYFTVGDATHPDMRLIYGMLEWLNMKTKEAAFGKIEAAEDHFYGLAWNLLYLR
ncbi:tetratricopeptide repeat (TPR)-like superfamily protein [Actinidia rufa]|uniref:Tetratricopeptide repeat (TPR)-like superfamily protein n=1 Tax=Actinidia rufa TaxID=165716 RepID=A0A7J0HE72_9ERIC|nr:tetratricopeptide repeat (TPR)-like superfamily protein [Actinidia rufa]